MTVELIQLVGNTILLMSAFAIISILLTLCLVFFLDCFNNFTRAFIISFMVFYTLCIAVFMVNANAWFPNVVEALGL